MAAKVGKYALRRLFGLQYESLPKQSLDQHIELKISPSEANTGCEKGIIHRRGKKAKKLMVKIPQGTFRQEEVTYSEGHQANRHINPVGP
ncbi:unnamed protein product [marine sediment metagenome]|uniref:Uncharacterized protein n=1 Tax=marine sediment metagenome TaxID=412755 RepID=X1UHK8_9ZZZZ